jgi:hypothetical protein
MINENGLRQSVIGAFEYLKKHEETLQILMQEVASLREALVQASDGKFLPILEGRRLDLSQKTGAAASAQVDRLGAAIDSLKSGRMF